MNDEDRKAMSKIDEQMVRIEEQVENLHNDIKVIKKQTSSIEKCVNKHSVDIAVIKKGFANHLKSHETTTNWIQWVPSAVAVIIALIAVVT